ncbi:MAG: Beta sliding clamp [Chloroflexi bacterium]|nr:Beta sliding clamp [Chloroflexota bacterium]
MTTASTTTESTLMKCTVSPTAVAAALSLVSRAVSPRSTLPILSNVLLETTADGLRLTATNLDLTITTTVPAEVVREGRVTVPARLVTEYVASLAEAPCTLELDPATQVLRIACGIHRTNIHGIDAVEFPPLPARDAEAAVTLDAQTLEAAIGQTAVAASTDEARPVLTGVLLQLEGEGVTLAATDGHRLAVRKLSRQGDGEAPATSVIVPARHLGEVARAITAARPTVEVTLSASRNHIFFTMRDVEVSSRLIEGAYPNYAQVIPASQSTTVTLPAATLLRETRTASILAKDAANVVRLATGEGTLTLHAQTAEVGDDEAPLAATVTGEGVQIAFNARYVLDALGVIDSEEVALGFNGPLSPGVIRPVGRDDYLYIVMPVRVPM